MSSDQGPENLSWKESLRELASSAWRRDGLVAHNRSLSGSLGWLLTKWSQPLYNSAYERKKGSGIWLKQGRFRLDIRKKDFHSEQASSGGGCPETSCTLHPWMFSKSDWIKLWGAWSDLRLTLLGAGRWTRDLPKSIPAWIVPWFSLKHGWNTIYQCWAEVFLNSVATCYAEIIELTTVLWPFSRIYLIKGDSELQRIWS